MKGRLYFEFLLCIFVVNGSIFLNRRELDKFDLNDINAHFVQRSSETKFQHLSSRSNRQMMPCTGTFMKTNGTTCSLKEIIIGRCNEYQYVKRNLYLANQLGVKNCSELYEIFDMAIRHKSYCSMNLTTYVSFFQKAFQGVNVIDRAMFWSGTYEIAHLYSNRGFNYITLEDTLPAGMADGLVWCGTDSDPQGYDYFTCPSGCESNREANIAFWGVASKMFAQRVAGEIFVVLNGSRTDGRSAFRNNSIFSDYELPNFRREGNDRVTKINVLLLHSPDLRVKEKCGEKSLVSLENLIRNAQFDYSCRDDPDELLLLMCGDQRSARDCRSAVPVLRREWNSKLSKSISLTLESFLILLLLFHAILI